MIPWIFWTLLGLMPCPSDMVAVPRHPGVCIDRYEWPNKKGEVPWTTLSGTPEVRDVKLGRVMDAEAICASVNKRVCWSDEWQDACVGKNRSKYPFGNKLPSPNTYLKFPETQPCNYAWLQPRYDGMKIYLRDVTELEKLGRASASGERGCVSASGAEDMMGNVYEWVRAPITSSTKWGIAGGDWFHPASCHEVVGGHSPKWFWNTTGVRCCSDLVVVDPAHRTSPQSARTMRHSR